MMQDNDQDKDDKYLSDLYSELSQEQPSASLDEKILSEARKEVGQQSVISENDSSGSEPDYSFRKKSAGPFSGNWGVPLSLAAVIVLSVSVVVMIEKDRPYSLTSPPEDNSPVEQALESSSENSVLESKTGIEERERTKAVKEKKSELKELRQIQNREVRALQQATKPEDRLKARTKMVEADTEAKTVAPEPQRIAKPKDDQVSQADVASTSSGQAEPTEPTQTKPAKPVFSVAPSLEKEPVGSSSSETVESARPVTTKPKVPVIEAKKESPAVASMAAEEAPTEATETPRTARPSTLADNEGEAQSEDTSQVAEAEQQLAASPPSALTEPAEPAAMMAAPAQKLRTFASGSSLAENKDAESCSSLSIQGCLSSRECTLVFDKVSESYQCQNVNNQCEKGFSQADDTREICESRPGCKYQASNCFCPPGVDCRCGGGTPAMCVPEE